MNESILNISSWLFASCKPNETKNIAGREKLVHIRETKILTRAVYGDTNAFYQFS